MYINSFEHQVAEKNFNRFNAAVKNALCHNNLILFNSITNNLRFRCGNTYMQIAEKFRNYTNLEMSDFEELCRASDELEAQGLL